MAYALAVCRRRSECGGGTAEGCLDVASSCPDLTFSPGSTRTVEGLKACAATYETLPCDQLDTDVLPPCVTPGTRAQGETCYFASQCSTLACKFDTECGKCARLVGVGESCAADDVDCASGSQCNDAYVCEELTITPPVSVTPAGPNEACGADIPCVEDYYCSTEGGSVPVCTLAPGAGQACALATLCASGFHCVETETGDRTCTERPGLGEPCAYALNSPIAEPYICDEDLLCSYTSATTGTCQLVPQAGEPCNIPPTNPDYGRCADSSCNFAMTPPTCGPSQDGVACETGSDCETDHACGCPDSAPDCTSRVCLSVKLGGESCGQDATSRCHTAFDCVGGTCQPAELRGAFVEACGG